MLNNNTEGIIAYQSALKVCCFGEILMRFSVSHGNHFIDPAPMVAYPGGAELNVATALSRWGANAKIISALPENYLADDLLEWIRQNNTDVSGVIRFGERTGIYYLHQGNGLKHSSVIYDRAGSSFSQLRTGMLDWEMILEDCSWFHISAITAALSDDLAAVCLEAMKIARRKNIMISVDLNYRENSGLKEGNRNQ